jgi:hypothetical protein
MKNVFFDDGAEAGGINIVSEVVVALSSDSRR